MNRVIFTLLIFFCASCSTRSSKDYFVEAEQLSARGEYEASIKMLDKAILLEPDYIDAYLNRGADKSALGRHQDALKDYGNVIRLDSSNTLALFNIGNNYEKLSDYNRALSYLNAAFETKGGERLQVELLPEEFSDEYKYDVHSSIIHYERGIVYYNLGKLALAYDDFMTAFKLGYHAGYCYYWLGHVNKASGKKGEACYYFGLARKHRVEIIASELAYCQ